MTKGISETAFASQVEDLFNIYHWHWAHFRPAFSNKGWRTPVSGKGKGFLDYIALRPPRILVAELKDDHSKMRPEQEEWFEKWKDCQRAVTTEPIDLNKWKTHRLINGLKFYVMPEVYLWRPQQIDEIVECLK